MDDMYPESPEAKGGEMEMQDDGKETALLPKRMIGKRQNGDTIALRIVSELEDEYEVECCDEKKEEGMSDEPSMEVKIERLAGK